MTRRERGNESVMRDRPLVATSGPGSGDGMIEGEERVEGRSIPEQKSTINGTGVSSCLRGQNMSKVTQADKFMMQ